MMEVNIEALEHQYQILFGDFQAGKIDEAMFTTEVDKLQFKDDWGRYWMLGSQSGAWHYYDGQAWHQADPRDADKLPFMDEQGRYWQKGAKSGDWYYYQAETGEWVKPGEGDPLGPASAQAEQWPGTPTAADYAAYAPSQNAAVEPDPAGQFGAELFQDDEGRYWAVGAKTGQWYFYDERGWHPAMNFRGGCRYKPNNRRLLNSRRQPTPPPRNSRSHSIKHRKFRNLGQHKLTTHNRLNP